MAYRRGPLRVEVGEAVRIRDSEGGTICTMGHLRGPFGSLGRRDGDEVLATAHLIAAAPEMLEALEAAERALRYAAGAADAADAADDRTVVIDWRHVAETCRDALDEIGTALRKARGEEVD